MPLLTPTAERLRIMNELADTGGELDATQLILWTNEDVFPGPNTTDAMLTEPTFDGYAPVAALDFGTAFVDEDGKVKVTAPSVDFVATGITVADSIWGWALLNTGGTALVAVERFSESKSMGEFIGQGFTLQPSVPYGV